MWLLCGEDLLVSSPNCAVNKFWGLVFPVSLEYTCFCHRKTGNISIGRIDKTDGKEESELKKKEAVKRLEEIENDPV